MVSMWKMPAEHADTAVMSRGNARMIGESRAARDVGVRHGRTDPSEAPSSTIEDVFALQLNRLFRPAPLMKNFSPIAIKRTTYCNDAILVPAKLGTTFGGH